MYQNLAILAVFVFLYSAVCGGLERTPVNGAVVYTLFGLALGPLGLGFLDLNVEAELLRTLAELTLALVLFTDAANANLRELKHSYRIPQRLLLIGLPLTILLGFAAGVLVFHGLTLLEIALLATMLAPTDAALGKAVVSDERVPSNIREALNVESGLNDGICVPILFLFLGLATEIGVEGGTTALALKLVAEAIGIGAVVGLGLTFLGVRLLAWCAERGWVTQTWAQLPVPALAMSCFAVAQFFDGSGFIACFVGGILFGDLAREHKHKLLLAAEGTGDTLALITWVAFGSGVIGQTIGSFNWQVVLYALLSLTLIRMLPVFLALTGTGLRTGEKLFIGWFGPRGLASVVFGVIVLHQHFPGGRTITLTAVCTIALSILGHGISANPLVKAFTGTVGSGAEKKSGG